MKLMISGLDRTDVHLFAHGIQIAARSDWKAIARIFVSLNGIVLSFDHFYGILAFFTMKKTIEQT